MPGDLSVVGYDNTYLSRVRHPLPDVRGQRQLAVGIQAGTFLAERLDSPNRPQRVHLVPTHLNVRGVVVSAALLAAAPRGAWAHVVRQGLWMTQQCHDRRWL